LTTLLPSPLAKLPSMDRILRTSGNSATAAAPPLTTYQARGAGPA